jgi:tetratricopeptide (TPR) repeat protein
MLVTLRYRTTNLVLMLAVTSMVGASIAMAKPKTSKKGPTPPSGRLAPPGASQSGGGVVALFSQAQNLFLAGKFAEALVAYDRILKKYPGHEPSTIQYAKTLYRLDRIPESYNLFARINPQYLDPETSYEYGYAAYVNNRWDAALFGFKRVPQDHALYDLANYYGALSAIKLQRYAEADDMLDKAVVLPDKLAKSKPMYQKHVQSLRQLQEKNELDQSAALERDRLKQKAQPAPIPPSTPDNGATKSVAAAYEHLGFMAVDRYVTMRVRKDHQAQDHSGYSETTFDNDVAEFTFRHGPVVPFLSRKNQPESSAVGLQLKAGVEDVNSKGVQERLVVYESSRDVPSVETKELDATHVTTGKFGAEAWVEFALPKNWWIGTMGTIDFAYPKFERGQRNSIRSGGAQVGKKYTFSVGKGSLLLSSYYEQLTDSETKPLLDTSISSLEINNSFSSNTNVETTARYYQFKYSDVPLMGPDSTVLGKLAVAQTFPLNFVLAFAGTAGMSDNYVIRNVIGNQDATAKNTALSGKLKLETTPLSWVTVGASYEVAKTTWNFDQADRAEEAKKIVVDRVEQSSIYGGLNFAF